MREKSIIKSKILEYLDYKGITKYEFYKNTGVSNGVLSQSSGMSEENIMRFLSHYSDVSLDWLLKDEGDMIKNENKMSDYSVAEENKTEYERIDPNSEAKKEIEFWKLKYFEVNEKYTALLESNIKTSNNDDMRRSAG